MLKRSKLFSLALAVLIVGVVAAIAVTAASSSGTAAKTRVHLATTKYAIATRLTSMFSVLQGESANSASSVATQAFPSKIAQVMTRTHPGLDPSAAAFAGGTYPAWVVPGTTEVCLIHEATTRNDAYGGVCGTIAAAERGLAVGTEDANHEPVIIGLVPNGNASVTVTNANGTAKNVPVTNNVYEVIGGHPSSVHLADASGALTTRHLPTPSEVPSPPSS